MDHTHTDSPLGVATATAAVVMAVLWLPPSGWEP